MSKGISMYPDLTPEQIIASGFKPEMPVFSYTAEDENRALNLSSVDGSASGFVAVLNDPQVQWNADDFGLDLSLSMSFTNVTGWFGREGFCAHDARLGLAFHWIAEGSDVQGVVPFADFDRNSGFLSFTGDCHFDSGFLKKTLLVETVVYLKNPGHPTEDEKYFAMATGTILGTLCAFRIYVDGNGSVFPVATVDEPDKPLWYVYFESDDIANDLFDDEHVQFRFNSAHKDYRFIDQQQPETYSAPFFREVLSSALTQLLYVMKQEAEDEGVWDSIQSGTHYEVGSIADALCYFTKTLHWDTGSLLPMSESVHRFIDKNMKGELL